MKIEILVTDTQGSSVGVTPESIWGDGRRIGVGGAELALLTMCQEWAKVGHQVILYNNPMGANTEFTQLPISAYNPKAPHEIVIAFRCPSPALEITRKAELKVWWSCDQFTRGDYAGFAPKVNKIIVISPFHAMYFKQHYGITDCIVIDIPVRVSDYSDLSETKIPNRILFSSVPDRGVNNLNRIWPKLIKRNPEISLVITSDYRLWGSSANDSPYRVQWAGYSKYEYKGGLPRKEFLREQLKADILLYPSNYDELFCIAVAEAQVAGAYPITSATGSLPTTNMQKVIHVDAKDPRNDWIFIDTVTELLKDRNTLVQLQRITRDAAIERFHPTRILSQWEKEVFS